MPVCAQAICKPERGGSQQLTRPVGRLCFHNSMSSRLLALVFPCRASSLRQGLRRSPLALAAPQSGSPQQKATSTGVVSPTQSAELATLQVMVLRSGSGEAPVREATNIN